MNKEALLALAAKWAREATQSEGPNDASQDAFEKGITMGNRIALNRCADDLLKLIKLLGD
jgi:hypothetical protein